MTREVAIVHFNTPELTEAAILSMRKHGGENYHVTIFDNSDTRPFKKQMDGVTVVDNTKGKVINFDKELKKYPDRDPDYGCAKGCVFGSDKHMMSVQKLWDIIDAPFLLMDSDILIQQSVDFMFQENQCAVGHVAYGTGLTPRERLVPYLLFINVPLCKERGARFFDPDRSWALHKGNDERNFWDTGAALLNDIRSHKNGLCGVCVDIRPLMVHLGSGSWEKNDDGKHQRWLNQYRHLWYTEPKPKYTVLTYIFNDYEIVHEIGEKDPEAEYLLITDDKNLQSLTWTVVYDESLTKMSAFGRNYFVRLHPFRYAHTDVVVRMDGSIGLRKPLTALVQAFNDGKYDRCLMIHPDRNTFVEEVDVWCKTRDYSLKVAARFLNMAEQMGYKLKYKGLYQGCFEIVRKGEINRDINNLTYGLMQYTGGDDIDRLDQHVTSLVINHFFSSKLKAMTVSEALVTDGKLMQWYYHKSDNPIQMKHDTIQPVLFNKPCQPWNEKSKPATAKSTNRKGK